MGILHDKSIENEEDISGHALMATCPTNRNPHSHPASHKATDIRAQPDIIALIEANARIRKECHDWEITALMAWSVLMADRRIALLSAEDFETITANLLAKVQCFG